jgi:hypothetical protein
MKRISHAGWTFMLNLFLPILVYLPFHLSPIVWEINISRVVIVMWMWGLIFSLHSIKGRGYIERIKKEEKNVQTRTS